MSREEDFAEFFNTVMSALVILESRTGLHIRNHFSAPLSVTSYLCGLHDQQFIAMLTKFKEEFESQIVDQYGELKVEKVEKDDETYFGV